MNSVNLIGRLTKDPEIRYTDSQMCIARFSIAIDRPPKKDGEKQADFPRVICFGKTAEVIEKYVYKGNQIGVSGRLQTGSYENKEGRTIYTTDVVADRIDLLGGKKKDEGPAEDDVAADMEAQGFEALDDDVPF